MVMKFLALKGIKLLAISDRILKIDINTERGGALRY
jgi:hypothetical protein